MKKDNIFETPILFIIFNRPKTEKKVFEQIRRIKPKYLFVAADGPRMNRIDDIKNCKASREIVDGGIDWDCKIKKLYRDENLGCKLAVSGAIDWFFENVEEGIILEDDCLPDLSFFKYCKVLLKKYSGVNNLMHISGDNFLMNKIEIKDDYYFSRFSHVWGWATWRRAWKKYNVNMDSYPEFIKNNSINNIWKEYEIKRYWKILFDKTYDGLIDTWDYQWTYAIWKNKGLSICPKVNLVKNIGFGVDSTHTKFAKDILKQDAQSLVLKNYPLDLKLNDRADRIVYRLLYYSSFIVRLKDYINKL